MFSGKIAVTTKYEAATVNTIEDQLPIFNAL